MENRLICGPYETWVTPGQHYKTRDGEYVVMEHGKSYAIGVANNSDYRCEVNINIDGEDMGTWVMTGDLSVEIERPARVAKKFTFYRSEFAPPSAGIKVGKRCNGVVICTFTPDLRAAFQLHVDIPMESSKTTSNQFLKFITYKDLLTQLEKDLAKDLDQYYYVMGNVGNVTDVDRVDKLKKKVTLTNPGTRGVKCRPTKCRLPFEDSLRVLWDEAVPKHYKIPDAYLSFFHKEHVERPVKVQLSLQMGEAGEATVIEECEVVLGALAGESRVMLDDVGTACFKQWPELKDENSVAYFSVFGKVVFNSKLNCEQALIDVLDRDQVMQVLTDGSAVSFTVSISTAQTDITIFVKTLTGKTIRNIVPQWDRVEALQKSIHQKEGIPPDQMRLLFNGIQLESRRFMTDYNLEDEATVFCILRLRGGGAEPSAPPAECKEVSSSKSDTEQDLSDPSSDWCEGATSLRGESQQQFSTCKALQTVEDLAVELTFTMVASRTENVNYELHQMSKCLSLSDAVNLLDASTHSNEMTMDSLDHAIEGLLNCPVCLEPFTEPKLLRCGHTFCLACLEQMDSGAMVTCPTCREETPQPAGGLALLTRDFRVGQIKDALQAASRLGKT